MLTTPFFETHLTPENFGMYAVDIPEQHALPFVNKKITRVVINAKINKKKSTFHAGIQFRKPNRYLIVFSKKRREELGINRQDTFELQLQEDISEYGAPMPEALQAVLDSDPEASAIFHSLTPGKQRNIIFFIHRYKHEQTQIDKALLITTNLKNGIRDLKELTKRF